MFDLRQSTAATVVVGPFLDKVDAVTPLTTLTIQTGRLTKNGAAGSTFTPTSWTHDGSGHYLVGVGTGDVDTRGALRIHFDDAATYLPVSEDYRVLGQAVYDVVYGATAPSTYAGGPVALTAAGLDAITVESGVNARQALSPILASACGVLSGAPAGPIVVKGGNVATTRITATVDANGNRSGVTLSLPS